MQQASLQVHRAAPVVRCSDDPGRVLSGLVDSSFQARCLESGGVSVRLDVVTHRCAAARTVGDPVPADFVGGRGRFKSYPASQSQAG